MEIVGLDVAVGDLFKEVQSAGVRLARATSVPEAAETALQLALELSHAAVAFIAITDESGEHGRVFSKTRHPDEQLSDADMETVFASAATGPVSTSPAGLRSTCARPLTAGGESLGMMGVASPAGLTATQEQVFGILAQQVAAALAVAGLNERRQEMVDTLVNLRADLDRSEKQRLINDERLRSAERVENAHEAAVDGLLAVSRHARTPHGLTDFHRRLTHSIAELVEARQVVFWQCTDEGMLLPIPGAFGVDEEFLARLRPLSCSHNGDDLASQIVFHDLMFRASRTDDSSGFIELLDELKVTDAIAVPWRAGDQRLGMLAAYESRRAVGFSREDTWVLQKAGLAAGLVWQLKYADADLKKTAERLKKVDAARQLLLKNVSTAVETARKRIAGDLHDDALQKLTAAELQVHRLHEPNGDSEELLEKAEMMLTATEDSLRRLLFEVRPPSLEVPGGFVETIHDRVRMLKSITGAEVDLNVDLPEDLSFEFRSTLYRQLVEALSNIEKHAAATQVRVVLDVVNDGVHGIVRDNGRGFVVAERDHLPGHLGLLALNERALLAGGWNKTTSEPGLGTVVEFWLPLSESRLEA